MNGKSIDVKISTTILWNCHLDGLEDQIKRKSAEINFSNTKQDNFFSPRSLTLFKFRIFLKSTWIYIFPYISEISLARVKNWFWHFVHSSFKMAVIKTIYLSKSILFINIHRFTCSGNKEYVNEQTELSPLSPNSQPLCPTQGRTKDLDKW